MLLSVVTEEAPHVPPEERGHVEATGEGFHRVVLRYGFMERSWITEDPARIRTNEDLSLDPERVTFFLGRETLIPAAKPGMAIWREKLFSLMSRNARPATSFFGLPPDPVVELGSQVEL